MFPPFVSKSFDCRFVQAAIIPAIIPEKRKRPTQTDFSCIKKILTVDGERFHTLICK